MLYKQFTPKDKLLKEFMNYLILKDVHSKNYYWQMKKCLDKLDWQNLSQEIIDNYLTELRQQVSAGTFNNMVKALKQFFDFLKLDYKLPKYHLVKKDRSSIKSIDEKKLTEILDACNWCDFQNPLKEQAVLQLMYYTGLRKSEVMRLKRNDINLELKTLNVFLQKVNTYKEFLLPDKVIGVIKNYYSSDPIEKSNAFNLGVGRIDYMFRQLKPCFKDIRLHPHLFKKSAVTWLAKFYSIEIISLLVGISIKTIREHYLDVNYEEVKKNYWKITDNQQDETEILKKRIEYLEKKLKLKKRRVK